MLSQHKFYVYYQGPRVMARELGREPVVAKVCDTPQEAHDEVQRILNPSGRDAASFGKVGFNSKEYQDAISGNCEAYVKAAYARAGT